MLSIIGIIIAAVVIVLIVAKVMNGQDSALTQEEEQKALSLGDKIAAGEKVAYNDAETSVQYAEAAVEQAVEPTKPYGDNPNCIAGLNGCNCALGEVAPATTATAEQEASTTPVNTETTAPTAVPASGINP